MLNIVTLATCHNRCECTLAVLSDLHSQVLPDDVEMTHVIVDDGSTDGTTSSVLSKFPEVEIVAGNGRLFWAGGMRHGWEKSVKQKSFDYLFVYNDDVRLQPTALIELLQVAENQAQPHAVVGSFFGDEGTSTSYGGRRRSANWHPLKFAQIVEPSGEVQEADTLNMNGALISKSALDEVGFLSDYFVHSGADFEFGLKLRKAGGKVLVAGKHIGHCDLNPASAKLPEHADRLSDGLKQLFDAKREPFRQRFHYYRHHGGWYWPLLCVSPYLTIWFRYIFRLFRKSN